jgi:CBS domain-containing protein
MRKYVVDQKRLLLGQRQFAGSARRGSAVVEYALLLAVIGCSALFGARLIATSGISQFNRLSGGPMVGGTSVDNAPADSELVAAAAQQLPTASAPPARSVAWQFGSLMLILGCGVAATVGLMMIRKKKEVTEESPEMVDSSTSGRRTERFARKRQDIYRVLCQNLKDVFTSNVRVEHILSPVPITVFPSTPIVDVAQMMLEKQFRHLLVCDNHGKLMGVISDRDVAAATGATAGEIMTPHPRTVEPTTDLRTAISVMLNHRFSSLPVVQQQRLIGIITVTDLIIMLQVTLQLLDKLRGEIEGGTLIDPDETAEEVGALAESHCG